jgi:putative transposase
VSVEIAGLDIFASMRYNVDVGAELMTKAEQIKNTLRETKECRKIQRVFVYELKLQNLSKRKVGLLERVFLEAKWLYNWLVSDIERLDMPVHKVSEVEVKVGDCYERRELTVLGSQVKQEIADRLRDNLRALGKLKRKGYKVGALKCKSFVNSIPLKQYGITYRLNFDQNKVRIQNLGVFRVLGLHQIPADAEIANAVLVRKPSGYYLHVTCYRSKERCASPNPIGGAVGIDFGVSSKLTLSNGFKIDFEVRETPRLKRLQRKLSRKQEGSRNRERVRFLLRREYEKLEMRRRDAQNKVLAFLKRYERVVFQDDYVKGWSSLFGGSVHSSGIGGLKSRLRHSLETPILVERRETTTRECFACGSRRDLSLSDRVMVCECGWECDRDVNAALVIWRKGFGLSLDQAVGVGRPELTPLERETAARILGSNPHIRVSFPRRRRKPVLWDRRRPHSGLSQTLCSQDSGQEPPCTLSPALD